MIYKRIRPAYVPPLKLSIIQRRFQDIGKPVPSEQPVLGDVRRVDRTREHAVVGDVASARERRWSASALDPS
jgi:hypothetical protein